ncbi:MAG: iron-only hydrogenase system regulator [Victivallales bacterium]|nr:iron-only hydrogenase system regulator [Victivallales bacterium]
MMETRIALIGIIVENPDCVDILNRLLHENRQYIVGRMGIPYDKQHVSIISIVIDAPNDVISALAGRLGRLDGVNVKTVYSKNKG